MNPSILFELEKYYPKSFEKFKQHKYSFLYKVLKENIERGIAEELYRALGNKETVCDATFPICNEDYLIESSFNYPISFNGKVRFTLELPAGMNKEDVEKTAMSNELTIKFMDGKQPKKIIVVPGKIVNIVI